MQHCSCASSSLTRESAGKEKRYEDNYEGSAYHLHDDGRSDRCCMVLSVRTADSVMGIIANRCHLDSVDREVIMQVTFEDIKRANESIQTTDIKGKAYAEVNQRIKAFRMCYPMGYILTELTSNEDGVAVMTARVGYYDDEGNEVDLGTGTAYEKEGSTFINKTSYIENCETSCVGRALGMAGFGIDVSVASAEEVQNAIAQQNAMKENPTISKHEWDLLNKSFSKDEIKAMYTELGISKGTDIPLDYYQKKMKEKEDKDKDSILKEKPFY